MTQEKEHFKYDSAFKKGVRFDDDILDLHTIVDGAKPDRNIEFRLNGFGSDLVPHPHYSNQFYALTDRGLNTDYNVFR